MGPRKGKKKAVPANWGPLPESFRISEDDWRPGFRWDGITFTVAKNVNEMRSALGQPRRIWTHRTTDRAHSDRAYCTGIKGGWDAFDVRTAAFYLGRTAHVFRVAGGRFQKVRVSQVTGGRIARWASSGAPGEIIADTSYAHSFLTYNRPGALYGFSVRAVSADARLGPRAIVSHRAPDDLRSANTDSGVRTITLEQPPEGEDRWLGAPKGLRVSNDPDNRAVLTWRPVDGARGYVVEVMHADPDQDYDPDGPYLQLSDDATPLLAGDLVIVDGLLEEFDDSYLCHRVGRESGIVGRYSPAPRADFGLDEGDRTYWLANSDAAPGEVDYVLRKSLAAGRSGGISNAFHSGTGRTFYDVLDPARTYRFQMRVRASRPARVTLDLQAPYLEGASFDIGSDWQTVTHDYSPARLDSGTRPWFWSVRVDAGDSPLDVDIAWIKHYDTTTDWLALDNEDQAPGRSMIRDHAMTKTGDLRGWPDFAVCGPSDQGWSLAGLVAAALRSGNSIWPQLFENCITEDEVHNIVAYLAAPVSSGHPFALRRQAHGYPQPLTEMFPDMVIELGNEAWNGFGPFVGVLTGYTDATTGRKYRRSQAQTLWWEMQLRWITSSPFWPKTSPPRILVGGHLAGTATTADYAATKGVDMVGVAAYTGMGWEYTSDIVGDTLSDFQKLLANAELQQRPRYEQNGASIRANGKIAAFYECGPTYQMKDTSAPKVIEQEVVCKSRGMAASVLDTMLTGAEMGWWGYNWFVLGIGDRWRSHREDGQAYITYATLKLIHDQFAPCRVLRVDALPAQPAAPPALGQTLPKLAVYALMRDDGKAAGIVAINRALVSFPGADDPLMGQIDTLIRTPWQSASRVQVWDFGVGNYRAHNRYPAGSRLTPDGIYRPDPLCVDFDFAPRDAAVTDVSRLLMRPEYGLPQGLPQGSFAIWRLDDPR